MIKVFYGQDGGYTLHYANKELKKKLPPEEYQEIIRFDGYKDLIQSVIEDCSSISLFGSKKTVVMTNCYFLSNSTSKKSTFTDSQQGNFKSLISYLNEPNEDCDLYLIIDGSIKKTGDIYEAISEGEHVYLEEAVIPNDSDYEMLANKIAKEEGKEIDKEAILTLISRSRTIPSATGFGQKGIDYLTFMNSLEKLLTYHKHVMVDDVRKLVYRPLDDNIFEIINRLMNKDVKGALFVYHDLRNLGVDPLGMLPAFASKFRDYALIKYLIETSYSNNDIAEILSKIQGRNVKPGSIYYRKKELEMISFKSLLRILSDLSTMEMNIKSYQDDSDILMELFISTFKSKYLRY